MEILKSIIGWFTTPTIAKKNMAIAGSIALFTWGSLDRKKLEEKEEREEKIQQLAEQTSTQEAYNHPGPMPGEGKG